jgi:hypothetical protein
MGKNSNQSGFSAVETVLILVILGILGFTGYFVWHAKQNVDKNLTSTNSTTPTYKKQTKTSTSQTTDQKTTSSVTLSRQDYSFTAPAGWKYATSHAGLGDVYEDAAGNQIIVSEGLAYDNNVQADYAWRADADISNGVKILAKSQACNGAGTQTSFEGFTYTCDGNSDKTTVVVFVAAQGGEIHGGSHIYRLFYEGKDTLLSQYENILGSFSLN